MKIYTRKGDRGLTSLYGGQKVSKSNLRVETYGAVDEANSFLGMAKVLTGYADLQQVIEQVQQDLFVIGAELATPDSMMQLPRRIYESDVSRLEDIIDELTGESGMVTGFVTPGDCLPGSVLDVSRAVVRRMERLLTALAREEKINPRLLPYVNRLSDLLFVMARTVHWRELKDTVTRLVLEELASNNRKTKLKEGVTQMRLTLDLAQQVIEKSREEAAKIGVPMVIAIVDDGGNLKSYQRMDMALLASVDIAINKAFTSVALKKPTHELADLVQPGSELYGLEATNGGRIVTFGGGFPIYCQGRLIGAIGVSGGSVEEDIRVAKAGLKVLNDDEEV